MVNLLKKPAEGQNKRARFRVRPGKGPRQRYFNNYFTKTAILALKWREALWYNTREAAIIL